VVIKFACKGLEEMQAAKKLADLPKEQPTVGKNLTDGRN